MTTLYKDVIGRWRTQSLFWEKSQHTDGFIPLWSMKDQDHLHKPSGKTYPSLKRIYIEMADPTEYTFALATLGSWEHWQVLCSRNWFKETVQDWRDELAVKLKAEAIVTIKEISSDKEDSRALQAARYLADQGWVVKNTKGRPSKDELAGAKRNLARKASELDEDAERIGLSIPKTH